jgi:glutamyl/glutaminyl-tRNA synthetase
MTTLSPSPASSYRGRLAPSPTGFLHVGHARTFWSAFERARNAGGSLVMRMEDLDPDRSRADYAQAALEDLRWLGIRWQEGPEEGGPCAPYAQSQRRAIYLAAWRKLLEGGYLFPCRCSRKDLEAALSAPHESVSSGAIEAHNSGEQEPLDDEPIYPGTCRTNEFDASSIAEPGNFNWRFRVPAAKSSSLWMKISALSALSRAETSATL